MRILIDALASQTLGHKGMKRATCGEAKNNMPPCSFELHFGFKNEKVRVYINHSNDCFQESADMLVQTAELVTVFRFMTGDKE